MQSDVVMMCCVVSSLDNRLCAWIREDPEEADGGSLPPPGL